MALVFTDSYFEVEPTLDDVEQEISNLVGLQEIKTHLQAIVDKINVASEYVNDGFTVVPPKPFHMVFVGNCGTGKSTVAQILGKLFFLSGALYSYTVTEMQGNRQMKDAGGGVLLVNIEEEDFIKPKIVDEIKDKMDEGSISVIFAGNHNALNKFMKKNKDLFNRFSARLQFDDLTCEELAILLLRKAEKVEDGSSSGYELDASCNINDVAQLMAEVTPEKLRGLLNSHLLDQMLIEAKKVADELGETTISLGILGVGMEKGALIYKQLLNL